MATRQSCVYTAQGEFICTNMKLVENKEGFIVNETPNIRGGVTGNVVSDALNQNYCVIQAQRNQQNGDISYTFKKECS